MANEKPVAHIKFVLSLQEGPLRQGEILTELVQVIFDLTSIESNEKTVTPVCVKDNETTS